MNLKELASRPIEDLKLLAAQYGLKPHHKANAATIAKMIAEHAAAAPKPKQEMQHKAEKPAPVVHNNTPEQVNEAIAKFLEKPGFTADYPGDGTWIFKCKGAEESGNLAIPLRVIVMKAQSVSVGKRAPMGMKGFEDLSGLNPLNAYTNNVLAI